jgi:NADPH2:quinone reductase
MRAYVVDQVQGAFREVDLPCPVPGPGQVLVRVHASGVNPLDTKIRAGKAAHARQPLPAVLGLDVAGEVADVGPGVSTFRRGEAVYGMAGGVGGMQGTLAEYVAVNAALLAAKPKSLSMRQAAALPLVTITAWEGIVDRAKVRSGQKVLVHAGAGGVGHIAVQLAKSVGAAVFATVSPDKRAIAEGLGANSTMARSVPRPATFLASDLASCEFDMARNSGQAF